jgi:hypothetical protein
LVIEQYIDIDKQQHPTIQAAPYNTNSTLQYKQHPTIQAAPYNISSTLQYKQHPAIQAAPYNTSSTLQYKQHPAILTGLETSKFGLYFQVAVSLSAVVLS